MLIIIKSAPETSEGKRGLKLACDTSSDIVLLQNGVYFMLEQKLGEAGFTGKAYVIEDDEKLRGLKTDTDNKNIQGIDYDNLIDLMTESDKVIGMF
jgi:sulfur relay protein TusB/DsrH